MTILIDCVPTLAESSRRCAAEVVRIASSCIARGGRFTMALCGGSTPRCLYGMLAGEPCRSRIDWQRVFLFWGDERCVAYDHPQSNFRLARETLLDQVPIPPENVFPMAQEAAPAEAARRYERNLRLFFGFSAAQKGFPVFDLILLGMGEDGHTASLFPGSAVLRETVRWVAPVSPPATAAPAVPRLTLTLPVINQGATLFFLVSGQGKEKAVAAILQRSAAASRYPAFRVASSGECRWFLSEVDCRLFANIQRKEMP